MGKAKILAPKCNDCEHRFYYSGNFPQRRNGVMMHFGETFCLRTKKARRFRRGDPKIHIPDWCPKQKNPHELRIYSFKNLNERMLHDMLCHSLGQELAPEARRYAVEQELTTDLSAAEFWKRCDLEPCGDLLQVTVYRHQVVEIDDGIKPVCFYRTERGYEYAPYFNTATARENKKEDLI